VKDARDPGTLDLFGHRPPGRPKSPYALTGAQRQARYRQKSLERLNASKTRFAGLSDVTLARYMAQASEDGDHEHAKALWLEFGRRMGFK